MWQPPVLCQRAKAKECSMKACVLAENCIDYAWKQVSAAARRRRTRPGIKPLRAGFPVHPSPVGRGRAPQRFLSSAVLCYSDTLCLFGCLHRCRVLRRMRAAEGRGGWPAVNMLPCRRPLLEPDQESRKEVAKHRVLRVECWRGSEVQVRLVSPPPATVVLGLQQLHYSAPLPEVDSLAPPAIPSVAALGPPIRAASSRTL